MTELARRPSPIVDSVEPAVLGRPLVHAEALLSSGPVSIPSTIPAARAIVRAQRAARAAAATGKITCNEAEVLEHALGARLVDLPLPRLSAVVDAVLALHTASPAEPSWASPLSADAADALLDACSDDLRAASQTHRAVYAQFTDRIWDVPVRRLQKGRRRWRVIAHLRLRRALAATSRTEKAPNPVSVAADLVLEAHAARDRVSTAAPLLASHLGDHDRGPLTNVDTARESLASVRDLQRALGDRLNPERLAQLFAAGAFDNDAVFEPARTLNAELRAWDAKVVSLGGARDVPMDATELVRWASLVGEALPTIELALSAIDRPRATTATVRDLVYDLLVRERCEKLVAGADPTTVTPTDAGTAS